MLLDALYFETTTIGMIRRLGMHVLIKGESMTHRAVVADAANEFDAGAAEWMATGYDTERLCRWWAEGTSATFAELREAGYCRWSIENHYFKQLNERTGSKRLSVKDV